jgi:hypothetical protein
MTELILFSCSTEFIKLFPLPHCDSLPTQLITTSKFYVLIIVLALLTLKHIITASGMRFFRFRIHAYFVVKMKLHSLREEGI